MPVTRTHKYNDRDHTALADGTACAEEHVPRYFAKSGPVDADPKKTKKNGGGKANWGVEGEEIEDIECNFANVRRRSNSSSFAPGIKGLKTKFEEIETEPVFEEHIHGPEVEELEPTARVITESSESGASIDEDEHAKKL